MSRVTLATMYGVGLVKKAPGTAGSLVAALLALPLLTLPYGAPLLFTGALFFLWRGTVSTRRYMAQHGKHDPKEVVIDELVGQWLTYTLIPVLLLLHALIPFLLQGTLPAVVMEPYIPFRYLWPQIALGFALFRVFDILKPWPICLADRKVKGGFGVMLDDVLAAIPAAILLAFLSPYLLQWFPY